MQNQSNPTRNWGIEQKKRPVRARGGMVAAKMPEAAEVGVSILKAGGNAVDAAVATAFAIGVVEPYMNGIGGGGYMVIWLEKEKRSLIIDYPMISGSEAHETMFPLADANTESQALLFGWPATVNNENVVGYTSIAVPGNVAGLSMALERYGTMSLAEVMQPAIDLAENGYAVTWHTTLMQALFLGALKSFPETVKTQLGPGGVPMASYDQSNPAIHTQKELARSLRLIAEKGPREFYSGELGKKIVADLRANGSSITENDFSSYEAVEKDTVKVDYHGAVVHTIGGGTGGLSSSESLTMLDQLDTSPPGQRTAEDYHMMAQVFRQTFADRYAYLADDQAVHVPEAVLTDPEYARERIATFDRDVATQPVAGTKGRLGIEHDLDISVPEYLGARSSSTTHLSVVDAEGNAVSITQTLLNLYGSCVVIPETGVLMNNGLMWFDPEPGRPNSPGPRKRPLSNMAPMVITRDDTLVASLGSSGGRKIQNCNVQVAINLIDSDMRAQEAIQEPQIETSTTLLVVSPDIDTGVTQKLIEMGHNVAVRDNAAQTFDFASPVAIRRLADGSLDGGADPWYFPATVVGVEEE